MAKEQTKEITLEDLKKGLKKKYDLDNISSDIVIPTGSLSLDMATGIGGFPLGKIVETFAEESAGKTFVAMKVCANAIKMGYNVAYIDSEFAIDKKWAKYNGFDIDSPQVIFNQPNSLEDALNIAIDIAESKLVNIIVLDSLSSMVPIKEIEGNIGADTVGLKARRVGQFLRKITSILNKNNVLLLTIGQLRDTIGGMSFGDTSTTDYGNSMKFFASMRIRYWKGIEKDSNKNPIANRTTVKILKNKCHIPFGTAKFDIVFGEGIDSDKELILMAKEYQIIKTSGSWYSMDGMQLGQGVDGVKDAMLEEPALKTRIITALNDKFESENLIGRIPLPSQSTELGEM